MKTNIEFVHNNDINSTYLESLPTEDRFTLLHQRYGKQLVASTSFGIQSSIMLHLISRHAPQTPVIFIDTGYLFPETYQYAETLTNLLGINLQVYTPKYTAARIKALWGDVWEQGAEEENRYAQITKLDPMNQALNELNAHTWISGIRRSQSRSRINKPFLEAKNKVQKAYPILDWTDQQVTDYQNQFNLPPHPLQKKGYVTSGDVHSTKSLLDVGSAEETRFNGGKYECGLHL